METDQDNEFGQCATTAEVIVAINHLFGLPGVERLIVEVLPSISRESLREAANDLKRVGLVEVAGLVRTASRKVKPKPVRRPVDVGRDP